MASRITSLLGVVCLCALIRLPESAGALSHGQYPYPADAIGSSTPAADTKMHLFSRPRDYRPSIASSYGLREYWPSCVGERPNAWFVAPWH